MAIRIFTLLCPRSFPTHPTTHKISSHNIITFFNPSLNWIAGPWQDRLFRGCFGPLVRFWRVPGKQQVQLPTKSLYKSNCTPNTPQPNWLHRIQKRMISYGFPLLHLRFLWRYCKNWTSPPIHLPKSVGDSPTRNMDEMTNNDIWNDMICTIVSTFWAVPFSESYSISFLGLHRGTQLSASPTRWSLERSNGGVWRRRNQRRRRPWLWGKREAKPLEMINDRHMFAWKVLDVLWCSCLQARMQKAHWFQWFLLQYWCFGWRIRHQRTKGKPNQDF